MKIKKERPPNYDKIAERFDLSDEMIFTYGDTIYSPKSSILPQHLHVHEDVHAAQQKEIGVDVWWDKFIKDDKFRLQQELEAYSKQISFIKSFETNKVYKEFLDYAVDSLTSPSYDLNISRHKIESMLRRLVKKTII